MLARRTSEEVLESRKSPLARSRVGLVLACAKY